MYRIIPELLFYTQNYVLNSNVNKSKIPFTTFDGNFLEGNKSFIRLLFDESWPGEFNSYRYLYREEDKTFAPDVLRRRMMLYPTTSKYYLCDSDSTSICNLNIFNLQPDDIYMLNNLLQYRIDSTSLNFIQIISNYPSLSTNLSKLIFVYLNFKINEVYTNFDSIISDSENILEMFYESFIGDLIFTKISNYNP